MKAVVASTRLGSASGHTTHDSNKNIQNQSPTLEAENEEEETEEEGDAADVTETQAEDPICRLVVKPSAAAAAADDEEEEEP